MGENRAVSVTARADLERCAVCIQRQTRICSKGNVLLKQWFKLMFSKIAKCSVPICLTCKEWIFKGHSRYARISSCHQFLNYKAGKWFKGRAVWFLGYSIMQGSLSLQRTLPKPVIEPPCTRRPVPVSFPENNTWLSLFLSSKETFRFVLPWVWFFWFGFSFLEMLGLCFNLDQTYLNNFWFCLLKKKTALMR